MAESYTRKTPPPLVGNNCDIVDDGDQHVPIATTDRDNNLEVPPAEAASGPVFIPPRSFGRTDGPICVPPRRRSSSGGTGAAGATGTLRKPHLYGVLQREDSTDSRSGFPGRSVKSVNYDPFRPVPPAVTRIKASCSTVQDDSIGVLGGRRDSALRATRRSSTGNRRSSLDNNRRSSLESQGSTVSMTVTQVENLTKAERAAEVAMSNWKAARRLSDKRKSVMSKIFDDPAIVLGYASVPIIDIDRLPRGGLSFETEAVGRIQFGIPPETIKDSMRLGIGVPNVYIVPVERFCREMGPALGINVAEFEFPAYFNYFVNKKQVTLVVDSEDAEDNIRRVFGETLLGPAQFRNHREPKPNEEEDFDPSFPREARPNFYNESNWFRTQEATEDFDELCLDMLVNFTHFAPKNMRSKEILGVPPRPQEPDLFDCFEESEMNSSGAGEGAQASSTSYHDSSLRSLKDSKRYKEVMQEKQNGRRHTTFLGTSDDEKEDSTHVDSGLVSGMHATRTSLQSSTDYIDLNSLAGERPRGLRQRAMSDPDLRSKALGDSQNAPDTIGKASAALEDPSSKLFRRSSSQRRVNNDSSSKSGGAERDGFSFASGASLVDSEDEETQNKRQSWMYSQAKWLGDVATIYPHSATEAEKEAKSCARVEIFKMTGGTEYIVHDVDENNTIVGKVRFSGTVRVPDEIAVEGFSSNDVTDVMLEEDVMNENENVGGQETTEEDDTKQMRLSISTPVSPPTFHPPSFGVTVLGNSHGFDKNGSTSGYVLWINGRGVMIDPPPYSSAALEREGIRPRMIMAIIITHCHADHDAGAFQKVMTGTKVAVITTPTIYKSFIRKYSALSGLSPALLRHSHRHRPAIIGQPLKFQGATFHFTYTLHTIPCIAFRVEWRNRSLVFSGDHMNIPETIHELEISGVLTKQRADSIRKLPLIDCDLLLHESGAPPIHTPLEVLLKLPQEVKKRLYVVHTSALPRGCELRVAPIGTTDTIRLDGMEEKDGLEHNLHEAKDLAPKSSKYIGKREDTVGETSTASGRLLSILPDDTMSNLPPLVLSRPTCVSDAWFILNLLSAVPFLSSLSYANTMEVLEIARVEVYCAGEIVIPSHRRSEALCVVWEGTCIERGERGSFTDTSSAVDDQNESSTSANETFQESAAAVWHAGDWTGPKSLQPECSLSGECSHRGMTKDVVALSAQGVKVILVSMKDLHKILKSGSPLYRKYLESIKKEEIEANEISLIDDDEFSSSDVAASWGLPSGSSNGPTLPKKQPNAEQSSSFLDTISHNSALGNLSALQKRHLESLAEGPRYFEAGQAIWQVGCPVEYAFLIVSGTATFAQPPRKRGINRRCSTGSMQIPIRSVSLGNSPLGTGQSADRLINVSPNSEYSRMEVALQMRAEEVEMETLSHKTMLLPREERARSARGRFVNKVLARLNARHAYTSGIVFSRGHFLSDTSRMVSGLLAFIQGKGEDELDESSCELRGEHHSHSSTIVAGGDGCVVMLFQRDSLISFFDAHPGVLLSLLGTQAVV